MSVMNRSIYIQLDKTLQATKSRYRRIKKDLDWKCVLTDMWDKVKDVDLSKYKWWIDKWSSRLDNNYAWLHIVNDIFWLFTKEKLDKIIKEISKIQIAIIEWQDELKDFFTQVLVLWKKEQNISVYMNRAEELIIDIYVPPEFKAKNHAIAAMKTLVWDGNIDWTNLQINVSNILKDKKKETEWIIKVLFRHLHNYRNKTWQSFIYEYMY